MRIPSDTTKLTRELRVEPTELVAQVWQAHVMKHPFGLGALYGLSLAGGRRWNAEGWDETDPPTITREERSARVQEILALSVDGARCGASRLDREEYRGNTPYQPRRPGQDMPCYPCTLASRCESVTHAVGERYAAALTDALAALRNPLSVRRGALCARLMASARAIDPSAVVLSVGTLNDGKRGARISAASGIRSELWLSGSQGRAALRWRTTYKRRLSPPTDRISFLMEVLTPVPGLRLSEDVLVARRWWEKSP